MSKKRPPEYSAGIPAVTYAVKMVNKAMSPGRAIKVLSKLNQKEGTDCPGCAWPDTEKRSSLGEFCENGVKAIAEEATDQTIDSDFFKKYSIEQLRSQSDYWLGQQGRLTLPMIKRPGDTHYSEISWSETFDMISETLKHLNSPNEAVFYTSGRTSNEAAFLYQLFVRMYGTNNMPDCSNMCHESSGVALKETTGIGKGSVTLEDFDKSDLILIFGQNPGTNHPRMLSALEKAKKNGARIVAINPLKEAGLINFRNPQTLKGLLGGGADISDLYIQLRINEDVALLKWIIKRLLSLSAKAKLEGGINPIDWDFIEKRTEGIEVFLEAMKDFDEDSLLERTSVNLEDAEKMLKWISESNRIIACWAMGLTQHENGVDNIREIVNLLLLKGSIGKEGAGTCPVRGHSNVQGDRTMGIVEKPGKDFIDSLARELGVTIPKEEGYDTTATLEALKEGKVSFFMSMGGNFCSATPDTEATSSGLSGCKLTVHVSTKLNRTHLYPGETGFILPCLGRTDRIIETGNEQILTVENSMGIVHSTRGFLKPLSSGMLSEPRIIAEIALRTVGETKVKWGELASDFRKIRDLIEKTIPGFENFNEKIHSKKQIELPNGPRNGEFTTHSGKAKFTLNRLSQVKLKEGELLLTSIRSHDQFNTTIYGLNDRYRGVYNERKIIFMNVADMNSIGINEDDTIEIINQTKNTIRKISGLRAKEYNIPKGCVAGYFPELNQIIPQEVIATGSRTPAYKSVPVRIIKQTQS